jgi:peptidoglycan/xylan/chitin deacetylase (PgdA/CDA1 family)
MDDGHKGNKKLLPVIKKYKIPVVVYCTAGITNTNRKFWFKLSNITRKQCNELKKIPDDQRRTWLKKVLSHEDKKQYKEPQALSNNDLKEFIKSECTIGSHTMYHPQLNMCSDEECKSEICKSKEHLEKITGRSVTHFAFPGGGKDNRCVKWLNKAGYKTSRTIDPGWVTPYSNPYLLKNFGIYDYANINKAMIQASGLWDLLKILGKLLKR